jgi:hypothetical protein
MRKALAQQFAASPAYPEKADEEPSVRAILQHCKVVADARNEIIHSSIYAETDGRTMLKNKRHGTRGITSGEVYDLANEVWDMHGAVYGLRFAVTRLRLAVEKAGPNGQNGRAADR